MLEWLRVGTEESARVAGLTVVNTGKEPTLMTCDGHGSNLSLPVAMTLASSSVSGVVLPAHFTSVLQECDASRGPIASLKVNFDDLVRKQFRYLQNNKKPFHISPAQLVGLVQKAASNITPGACVASLPTTTCNSLDTLCC